jgi:hypothetical protein
MKKLLALLISIFFLYSSSVFADDISDFQIEGMSIGDSLLDYMTENEILKEIENRIDLNQYYYLKEPIKFIEIYFYNNLQTYDQVAVFIKHNSNKYVVNKNEKYTIVSIRGMTTYNEDFDSCIQERNQVVEILSTIFPNAIKTESVFAHQAEPSGESSVDGVYYNFDSGVEIDASCNNWIESFRIKNNYSEGLSISISTKEINDWIRDY